jgi:hypothetical protein
VTPAAAVKSRLSAITGLTSLVSARIYVDLLPQKPTLPAVRVQRISEIEDAHLRGVGAIRRARVQVDAIATSLETATQVSDAAHGDGAGSGLSGWQGDLGSPAVRVMAMLPTDTRSDYEGDELKQWRVSRDYFVWMR